ncbi:T9SS C-terminal target domain-containing protein [Aquimarina sp. BL5]|uniref:YDG domain-containing protein n=1 Tax=Aquimarina sp. BL5 TaxID=1714860 RepID=UPI000E4F5E67|nr:YDG domain-containing protein [Aquimarina sp. BL5]AXT50393.1 T9SS C-terminal target domain-containing protein [Aquimarina sp. BL5]
MNKNYLLLHLIFFVLFSFQSFSMVSETIDSKLADDKKEVLEKDSKTNTAEAFTSLGVGDLGFSSFNTDGNDEFSFVLLTDISGTTTIHFTDDGFNSGTGTLLGAEGTVTWTYTGSLPAGAEVSILLPRNSNTTGTSTVGGIETGTTTETGSFSMSSNGESIIAYTGTVGSPTTYIAAIFIGTTGFTEATSTTTSAIPTGLSIGANTAMQNGSADDNYQFNCALGDISTVSNLRESLFTISNFVVGINSENYQAPDCNYLVVTCAAPTAQATSAIFGTETSSTLILNSYTAPAGGADGYAVYINSTNSFTTPSDGDEPVADLSWNDAGQQPIYFGTSASPTVTVTGLDPGTTYFFQIYAYNDCSGTETYETTGLSANDATATAILTIPGLTGVDKEYDDTTVASATGTASLSGVIGGDDVTLGGSPVFTFASANVGTGITVNTTGYTISGTDAGKYTLTQPTLAADITAKNLTIIGLTGVDKEYDDTTAGSATGTASLSGVEAGDDVSLGGSPVFTFASANVGTGITINTSGYTISGTDSGNYTLTQSTLAADITAKNLTIIGLTGVDKEYDDTTAGSATGTASLSGVEAGDDVSLGGSPVFTFASANVGTGITINTSGYTISGTDSGNYTLTQPTLAADITAKNLTIIGLTGVDKVYDDTTAGSATGTASLSGVEAGDDVSLGGSPVFTFASANVGTGITINTSGYTISGTDSGNYTLTQSTLSADITAKELTITGLTGDDKPYDGTTAATATGTASLQGIVGVDDVVLGGSPVFTFASADVGTGITINTTGYTISGTDSGNYTLTQPTLSADITGTTLTITSLTGDNKTYDGTTAAGATGTAVLSGVIGGDDVTLSGSPVFTFASADVGTGITITTSGYTLSGADAGKYNLIQPTLSGDITVASLTITGLTGDDKVYDGTTSSSATGTAMLSGIVGADDVTLGGSPIFTFASANVGTGITINTSGYTISGTDSGNYTFTQPTLSADITATSLTITGLTGDDKVYDGTTSASATGTAMLSGIVGADNVSLGGSPVFTFASVNVGTGITITTTGYTISGTDSGNYSLTQPTLSADITATSLTITGLTGDDKVYNGTTSASATGTAMLSGIVGADDVTLGGAPVFTFASANVGTGITINTSGYTISGTDSGNYTLTQPTLSADITATSLTITGLTGDDKVYDRTTSASATGTAMLSGIVGADDVSLGGSPVFTFASANVGTGITITTTGYTISGTDSGNYTMTQPTLSADITAKELTITGITGDDKIYDGTTAATASGTAVLSGVEVGDDVTLGGSPVFTFASPNGGTGIAITTTGYIISGADSGNYTLTQPTLSADITGQTVAITSTEVGTTGANPIPVTITFSGAVTGFEETDITVGNGAASNFTGTGAVYTVDIIPTASGVVTVDINANVAMDAGMTGNVAASQFSIVFDDVLGIEDEVLASGLRLYPIPATNSITINADTILSLEKAEIFDIQGKMVLSKSLKSTTGIHIIDISSMESGVYLMTIYSENGLFTKRIMKK